MGSADTNAETQDFLMASSKPNVSRLQSQELESPFDECGQRWDGYIVDDDKNKMEDKASQTFITENINNTNKTLKNNVSTQTLDLNYEVQNIIEANNCFGNFVARELGNVQLIKRREIMWEIIRIFEHKST